MTIAIGFGIALLLGIAVWYDARGRRWTGWTTPSFWGAMTVIFAIVAIPCYLLARARTTKRGEAAKAGWYSDPSGAHSLRYWDGATWTSRVADHSPEGK